MNDFHANPDGGGKPVINAFIRSRVYVSNGVLAFLVTSCFFLNTYQAFTRYAIVVIIALYANKGKRHDVQDNQLL